MCSARDNVALPTLGCPIRESADHWLFSAFPRLFAAVHALLRLLVPRHPPCALNILTVIWERAFRLSPGDTRVIGYCAVFKVREEAYAAHRGPRSNSGEPPAGRRSLKTQQHAAVRPRCFSPVRAGCLSACGLPGPVDISSGRTRSRSRRGAVRLRRRSSRRSVPRRAP